MLGLFSGTCGCGKGTLKDPHVKETKNIRVIFWYRCFVVCERVGWEVELLSNIGPVPLLSKYAVLSILGQVVQDLRRLGLRKRWKRLGLWNHDPPHCFSHI